LKLGPYELNGEVYVGDSKELAKEIPDESIQLIHTDPPYPKEFEQVYYDMGVYAPRILKPGGSLITLCGHHQVPLVIDAMKGLSWHWMGWMVHSGPKRTLFGYKIVCGGKPLLWFSKGPARPIDYGFWWDTKEIRGMKRDKEHHEWGQSAAYIIQDLNTLTNKDDIIFDPFAGGGTCAAVCKMLGRNYLTFEIDPEQAKIATARIAGTNPPLFTLHHNQLELIGE
jgi:DNA modification methylase